MIADPPLDTGAVHDTVTAPSPRTPTTPVGAPGTPVGVTAVDGADTAPLPTALVAITVNVYAVPFVNPVTTRLAAGGVPVIVRAVCAVAPIYGTTVYLVITLPPLAGAVHDTVAEPEPATADTPVGASGARAGVTAADADDNAPVPSAFVAATLNVYAVPFVNPVTVTDVAGGAPVTVVTGCATVPMKGVTV